MLTETTTLIMFVAIGLALIAFPQPLAFVINKTLNRQPVSGTRIITRQQFVDVETRETFHVWRSAYGFRVWIASLILKI